MDGASHKMLADIPSHAHYVADATLDPSMRTEQIVVPSRHAATGIFQGTRGMYCTLPGELALPLSPHSPFPRVILAEMDRLPAGSPATESNSGAAFDPLSYRGAPLMLVAIVCYYGAAELQKLALPTLTAHSFIEVDGTRVGAANTIHEVTRPGVLLFG